MCHGRLGHTHLRYILKIDRNGLVKGLSRLFKPKDNTCDALIRSTHKPTNSSWTSFVLENFHIDLFESDRIKSINGRQYYLVIVDTLESIS